MSMRPHNRQWDAGCRSICFSVSWIFSRRARVSPRTASSSCSPSSRSSSLNSSNSSSSGSPLTPPPLDLHPSPLTPTTNHVFIRDGVQHLGLRRGRYDDPGGRQRGGAHAQRRHLHHHADGHRHAALPTVRGRRLQELRQEPVQDGHASQQDGLPRRRRWCGRLLRQPVLHGERESLQRAATASLHHGPAALSRRTLDDGPPDGRSASIILDAERIKGLVAPARPGSERRLTR
ncbi:hypothetical protein [Cyprinid herpesvirus 3]|uniref:Uncharacterized protein n=1 Tax=Cyprinid herpesvirus 3 TaxID=180230 RepID=A4FTG7_CYHV3|nr:hypothetical protein [Cyprinid herpesvirus 3]